MAGELPPLKRAVAKSRAEIVCFIDDFTDDLLIEILLRLPLKSLVRFELVSREWHTLITKTVTPKKISKQDNTPVGLIVDGRTYAVSSISKYLPFSNQSTSTSTTPSLENLQKSTTTTTTTTTSDDYYEIRQSCNGLLLIGYSARDERLRKIYYVCNPTTNKFFALPRVGGFALPSVGGSDRNEMIEGKHKFFPTWTWLAFDPVKSPHYKVVGIKEEFLGNNSCVIQIYIYSSEIRLWRPSGQPVTIRMNGHFYTGKGVYWNGNIHWENRGTVRGQDFIYFDMKNEMLKRMPRPQIEPAGIRFTSYCGESCDHLHFAKINDHALQFNIYELHRDYSGWFIKFHVDLSAVPSCMDIPLTRPNIRLRAVIRGEDENDCSLILIARENDIRYNVVTKAFETLSTRFRRGRYRDAWFPYQYIESLCSV